MPATPHKEEAFILTADAEAWENLEALLTRMEDEQFDQLLRTLRYKLWRTGHRLQPE